MKNSVYVVLRGRIGNQLFIYAFAREVQERLGVENTEVIIDDSEVVNEKWENSLQFYDLKNVRFVHNRKELFKPKWILKYFLMLFSKLFVTLKADYMEKSKREKILKPLLEKNGIFFCENGYLDFKVSKCRNYLLYGFFQSKKYFPSANNDLINTYNLKDKFSYPGLDVLKNSNSVCISVKIEHNIGSSLYAVCGKEYWQEAINLIISKIENPVFFICSDDVEYVKNNLIDCTKYKVLFQDKNMPVHVSLAAMSCCKHFIIGNTSYGWWAQYMSENSDKITIAPSQWMLVDIPIDIYEDSWTLIDVKKYLGK